MNAPTTAPSAPEPPVTDDQVAGMDDMLEAS